MKSLFLAAFVLGVFLATPTSGASICVVPEVPEAFHRAGAVFVGKIVNVAAARRDNGVLSTSDYLVKFEVEESWKGTLSNQVSVLWRTEVAGCSYYSTGQIGERYLVYADLSSADLANKDRLEITIFNRTSSLPPKTQIVTSPAATDKRKAFSVIEPELNRRDASNDLQALRRIKDCECLRPYSLPTCMGSAWVSWESNLNTPRSSLTASPCCSCLRRTVTPVDSRFPH